MTTTPTLFDYAERKALTCMAFDGETFDANLDAIRLNAQLNRVYQVMRDGNWHTLGDICERTGDQAQSVSARLRDFRKAKFGGFLVERQRIGDGLFQYRLRKPQPINL